LGVAAMHELFASLWPLLAEAAEAGGDAAGGGGGAAAGGESGFPTFFLPVLLIGILFYFMLIRPERKKSAEQADMLKTLKKNDHVVTIGGIFGTVVNVNEVADVVTLRVDENSNAKLRVRRSAISAIVKEEPAPGKDEPA
jgi:preprotein translocase subunit YajC